MAEKIKYTRKDLKEPDEFISGLGRGVAWVKDNRKPVLAALAALTIAITGVLGTWAYLRWEENKATADLWPHLNRARQLLQSPGQADEEKLARLEQFLTAFTGMHPNTGATVYARYYLGSIAFLRGDYDLSATQFRAALASGKEKELLGYFLRIGLAQALEAKRDFIAAAAVYGEAAEVSSGELKGEARFGQARSLAAGGRTQDAVSVYRRILTENADPSVRDFVELTLAQLG